MRLRPNDEPALVQREVGRVEEEDLPYLRSKRIEPEGTGNREVLGLGDRRLQLDAVRIRDQVEQLCELVVGKQRRDRGGHTPTIRCGWW